MLSVWFTRFGLLAYLTIKLTDLRSWDYFSTQDQVGLDSVFPLIKWDQNLKTVFYIYSSYLCVILKWVWWAETSNRDEKKEETSGKGKGFFFRALY